MKTIEEKAKAYDEAIERAKKIMCHYPCDSISEDTTLEIFPELAENEDERIYNEIMEFFKMNEKRCIVDNSYTRWIAWFEKQKPVKWSEEDEKMLIKCISAVMTSDFYYEKYSIHSWLKSLRPQPKWKPSEEQIKVLDKACHDAIGKDYHNALRVLQIDLKTKL